MANYANLKATINANIKANGNEEITGPILNTVLNQAVTTLGAGYQYMGVATPATSPGTPDANVFYIAATPGTYTNFGGKVVADGEVAILKYNGSWTKEVSGAATAAQVTQLGQDVTEKIGGSYVPELTIEQGAITSGVDVTNNKRIRTNGYIVADAISITTSGSKVFVVGYNDSDTYIDYRGWITTSQDVTIPGCTKYRLVFAKSNDGNITPSEYDSLGITISALFDPIFATKEEFDEVADDVNGLDEVINGGTETPIDLGAQLYGRINASGAWESRSSVGHYMVMITPGKSYTITAKDTAAETYAVLAEYPTYDYGPRLAPSTAPVFSSDANFSTLKTCPAGESVTFTAPADAVCLYLFYAYVDSLKSAAVEGLVQRVAAIEEALPDIEGGAGSPFERRSINSPIIAFHRAKSSAGAPENTAQAVLMAYYAGCKIVECDIKTTSDGQQVIMHDVSINRTMMNNDGTDISSTVNVYQTSLATLRANYKYKALLAKWQTPICTFDEWIDTVKKLDMIPFLHGMGTGAVMASLYERVYNAVGDNFIFMGTLSACQEIRTYNKNCYVWLQNSSSDEDGIIEELKAIGGPCGYSSMTYADFTDTFIEKLRANGFGWQLSVGTNGETRAIMRGCTSLLTDGVWCDDTFIHKTLYSLPDSDGIIEIAPSATRTFTIDASESRNIKAVIELNGTFRLFLNSVYDVASVENYTIVEVGRNIQSGSITLSIMNTGSGTAYVRELVVFGD